MQSKPAKRENQEYFAAWDKKIERTWTRMLADMAIPIVIFIMLNIFTIAILVKLNVYDLNF
ncbi:hypothetical protein EQO05_00360 [Methanosarcina sp. MSH10X1]|uniref:hypothetical protein n=1 Tax=Methanosarcina sp. MSH10X1 TaxID=2507075 RepID=UPI000FFB1DD4|nr:hypothetical protein [Methanosarcina sp. MSH10X1]RXA21743.1 hypothetical protein EQO05_00360 [Methanosarcina sp. MSH10X1]